MLPIIAVVGAAWVGVTVAAYLREKKLHRHCHGCGRTYRVSQHLVCALCTRPLCSACLSSGPRFPLLPELRIGGLHCQRCAAEVEQRTSRYAAAERDAQSVEIVPSVPEGTPLQSDWWPSRDDAERQLRMRAALQGHRLIERQFAEQSSQWQAKGRAAKRR